MARSDPDPFGYCLSLEQALTQLHGQTRRRPGRWSNSASAFTERKNASRAVQDACTMITKALNNNVVANDRLMTLTRSDIKGIAESAKKFANRNGAVVSCIGHLISLVSHLLGHDGNRGKPHRYLFYIYTRHRDYDFNLLDPGINPSVCNKRVELINQMWKQGMKIEDIASVMNLAVKSVNNILIRIHDAEEASARSPSTLLTGDNAKYPVTE